MIYELFGNDIELSKLEHVGKIYEACDEYTFSYQLNGVLKNPVFSKDQQEIKVLRENLVKKWQEFKQSNIYQMNDVLIDLNKLERISEVQYNGDRRGYRFRYSVNGFTWDVYYVHEDKAKKMRDNLLKSWYSYKGIK